MAALALGFIGAGIFGSGSLGAVILGTLGGFVDKLLFNRSKTQHVEGPRLDSLSVTSSTEGSSVQDVIGIYRIPGRMIWATDLVERVTTEETGGKGGMFGAGPKVETTKYTYFLNCAMLLGEGPIDGIARVWADSKLIKLEDYNFRLYRGTATQEPDPLIRAKEGTGETGPNIVRAHDFASPVPWTLETGWSFISSGEATHLHISGNPGNQAWQDLGNDLLPNTAYEVEISAVRTGGGVVISLGGEGGSFYHLTQTGTPLTFNLTSGSEHSRLVLTSGLEGNANIEFSYIKVRQDLSDVPAYRNRAYIVLEEFPLEKFGQHVPNFTFEVIKRPVSAGDPVKAFRAVTIGGVSEFAAATTAVASGNLGAAGLDHEDVDIWPVDGLSPENTDKSRKPNFRSTFEVARAVSPDLEMVNITATWFGDDLRCAHCEMRPRVSSQEKRTVGMVWNTAGFNLTVNPEGIDETIPGIPFDEPRKQAIVHSRAGDDGVPYGVSDTQGDPFGAGGATGADESIKNAIEYLHEKDLKVMFTPLLSMDISDNVLPNPYSDNAAEEGQPRYPRARKITCSPAAGYAGTVDKTADAATQVELFFGEATPDDFGEYGTPHATDNARPSGEYDPGPPQTVIDRTNPDGPVITWQYYEDLGVFDPINLAGRSGWVNVDILDPLHIWREGNSEISGHGKSIPFDGEGWGYRRFVLHYATLCKAAGFGEGDAFIVGSGLSGLTRIRSAAGTYPAVEQLISLVEACREILGPDVLISYAADWDEALNHRPDDGSNDVYFHLDPLWAHEDVGFVGINNFLPLSDWRTGDTHLDKLAGTDMIYHPGYLFGNTRRGEYYEWTYASDADRDEQIRTPIVDPLFPEHNERWVYRLKDHRRWWNNEHHNRPGGVRDAAATAWEARMKPLWFTAYGCPAVDKGTNQPDALIDEESDDGAPPYFSTSDHDGAIQYAYFKAMRAYIDLYPAMFEYAFAHTWSCDNTKFLEPRGRILNYMGTSVSLADALKYMCRGLVDINTHLAPDIVRGYYMDKIASPRGNIEPLAPIFLFDACEDQGEIHFVQRRFAPPSLSFTRDDLVDEKGDANLYRLTRAEETDLPRTVVINTLDPQKDDQPGSVSSRRRRSIVDSVRELALDAPLLMTTDEALARANRVLADVWIGRERMDCILPPSAITLRPTDVINIEVEGRPFEMRIDTIGRQYWRPAKLTQNRVTVYESRPPMPRSDQYRPQRATRHAKATLLIMDLPLLSPDQPEGVPLLAAYSDPWADVAVYRGSTAGGFVLDVVIKAPSVIGRTKELFPSGALGVFDEVNELVVQVPAQHTLLSIDDKTLFDGGNMCAVRTGRRQWEVMQFGQAEIIEEGLWRLTHLVRGMRGTEHHMSTSLKKNATFVMLDRSIIVPSTVPPQQRGTTLQWRYGPATLPINDDSYRGSSYTFNGASLRPLAPTGLRAAREADGDIILKWIRRSRVPNYSWDAGATPLAEEQELYRVNVYDGDEIVETADNIPVQEWRYSEAEQIRDFGRRVKNLDVEVIQKSHAWGPGPGTRRVVKVNSYGSALLDETLALLATASNAPPPEIEFEINVLIETLIALDVWDEIDVMMMIGHDDAISIRNWKDATGDSLLQVDQATVRQLVGFRSLGGYFDTQFNPSTAGGNFGLNSNMMLVCATSVKKNATACIGNANHKIVPRSETNTLQTTNSSSTVDETANKVGSGIFATIRNGATEYMQAHNDTVETITRASSALTNANVLVCTDDAGGGRAATSVRGLILGGGITEDQYLGVLAAIGRYLGKLDEVLHA